MKKIKSHCILYNCPKQNNTRKSFLLRCPKALSSFSYPAPTITHYEKMKFKCIQSFQIKYQKRTWISLLLGQNYFKSQRILNVLLKAFKTAKMTRKISVTVSSTERDKNLETLCRLMRNLKQVQSLSLKLSPGAPLVNEKLIGLLKMFPRLQTLILEFDCSDVNHPQIQKTCRYISNMKSLRMLKLNSLYHSNVLWLEADPKVKYLMSTLSEKLDKLLNLEYLLLNIPQYSLITHDLAYLELMNKSWNALKLRGCTYNLEIARNIMHQKSYCSPAIDSSLEDLQVIVRFNKGVYEVVDRCFENIKSLRSLRLLTLSNHIRYTQDNLPAEADFMSLKQNFARLQNLESLQLDLLDEKCADGILSMLTKCVQFMGSLKKLNVYTFECDFRKLVSLSSALTNSKNLTSIDFTLNKAARNLGEPEFCEMTSNFGKIKNLQSLTLITIPLLNILGDQSLITLHKALMSLKSLSELEIDLGYRSDFTDYGVTKLAKALTNRKKMQKLYISFGGERFGQSLVFLAKTMAQVVKTGDIRLWIYKAGNLKNEDFRIIQSLFGHINYSSLLP